LWNLDEDGFAAGKNLAGGVGELRFAVVASAVGFQVARSEGERRGEGDRAEVVDGEMARHGENAAGAVRFAHGFVEQGGDDAAVGVARGSRETAGEAGVADDGAVVGDEEAEMQSGGVFEPAPEAVVESAVGERGERGFLVGAGSGHGLGSEYRGL